MNGLEPETTNVPQQPAGDEQKLPMKWYVLRTYSGHELKVKAGIESQMVLYKMEPYIGSVLVPSEKVVEVKDGKKKTRTRNFFPGYILVQMAEKNPRVIQFILSVPSVLGFVPKRDQPQEMSQEEIRRLIGRIEEKDGSESVTISYQVGDAVKVTEGPFNNFQGFIQEINMEKMKVKVMVSIFGRKTPVELDFSQIEIEK